MKHLQTNYSILQKGNRSCHASRHQKGLKTLSILRDFTDSNLSSKRVLEIGCFEGEISLDLAPYFKDYHAIDIDPHALAQNKEQKKLSLVHFHQMSAGSTSFKDESFDIVICSHVYEHVPDPFKMMDEILRVLKPGGFCYFAAANRIQIIDSEYGLPFATLLPKVLAHWYVRVLRHLPEYYETFYFYPSIRKLANKFTLTDYTRKIIAHPEKFAADDMITSGSFLQKFYLFALRFFYWASPAYIWILKKAC